MHSVPYLWRFPAQVCLGSFEHVHGVVYAPGLDADLCKLDGEAGRSNPELKSLVPVLVGELDIEGNVVLSPEQVVELFSALTVAHGDSSFCLEGFSDLSVAEG